MFNGILLLSSLLLTKASVIDANTVILLLVSLLNAFFPIAINYSHSTLQYNLKVTYKFYVL